MKYLHYIVIAVVSVSVIAGLYFAGSPNRARALRFDERRVSDLQGLQNQILWQWQSKKVLPKTLADLNTNTFPYEVPTDPETKAQYEYRMIGALQFELCATFALPTPEQNNGNWNYKYSEPYFVGQLDWTHEAGHVCYTRTINKEQYDKDQANTLKPVPVY